MLEILETHYPQTRSLLNGFVGRLRDLPPEVQRKFWIVRAEETILANPQHWIKEFLFAIERAASGVEGENKAVVTERFSLCLPAKTRRHRSQYDSQFLDVFTELLAYDYLSTREVGKIRFVAEGADRSPDLLIRAPDGRLTVVECKNVHQSERHKDYFAHHQGEVRQVNYQPLISSDPDSNPFLSKLKEISKKAGRQFADYPAGRHRRLLFINYTPDTDLQIVQKELPQARAVWDQLASDLHRKEIDLVVVQTYDVGEAREYFSDTIVHSPTARDLDRRALKYSASIAYDRRLYRHDIAASIAHARMLARQGIIPGDDGEAIVRGLHEICDEIERGHFPFREELEDIHLNIEVRLREKIGEAAGRLHTARSRNDQIATDMRLFVMEACDDAIQGVHGLQTALLDLAEANRDVAIPGYTHLQRAQPILLPHHLLAYFEMLDRDAQRFHDCRTRADELPLGSGALAGVSYPIDREFVARELGFSRVSANSVDAVSDRDFVVEFQAAAATTMMHLSRLCEEIVLWSTDEFAFVRLPERFATGSSIMPQKRNPDVAELARGRTGRVYGNLIAILTMLKGLPLAYNRDLQEDKQPLFDTVDTLLSTLEALASMLPYLIVDAAKAEAAASSGSYTLATDVADYLVRKGLPFRDAHQAVVALVQLAQSKGKRLDELTLADYRAHSSLFDEDVLSLDVRSSIAARDVPGGTAPERVASALKEARQRLRENA